MEEHHIGGEYLGQYNYAGENNGRPYYKQLNTIVGSSVSKYLYSDNKGHWYVGGTLGDTKDYSLHNPLASEKPPATGWKYEYAFKLYDDLTLLVLLLVFYNHVM